MIVEVQRLRKINEVLAVVSPIIKNFLHIWVIPSMFDIPEIIKIAGNIPAVDELEFYGQ